MCSKQITILLSSYNGEKFIEEQIESIINQKDVDLKLIVRDDGSNDTTVDILERYKQKGALDYYIGNNIGWKLSFMQLALNAPDCDYYAFSDQDDHWLPDKLSVAIEKIEELPEGPNLYISNTYYWRGDMKVITNRKMPNVNHPRSLIWSLGPGCTIVFNKKLLEIVKKHPMKNADIPHDIWFQNTAYLFGNIYYDMNPHILYRQHGNNQLGVAVTKKEIIRRRYKYYKELKKRSNVEYRMKQLLTCYEDELSNEKLEVCREIADYRSNVLSYLHMLITNKFNNESLVTTIGLKLRVLFRHL